MKNFKRFKVGAVYKLTRILYRYNLTSGDYIIALNSGRMPGHLGLLTVKIYHFRYNTIFNLNLSNINAAVDYFEKIT